MAEASNPRLLRPFFGAAPVLPRSSVRTLLLVSLGMMFENYDIGLVNAALKQIASELGIAAADTGFYLAAIRLGGVGAFLLVPLADRIGRRRTFLACFVGMSLGTFATGLAQTALQFALCQMLARAFLLTASALSIVILVEELPAAQRAAGIGLLSLLGGLGFGLCAGLYAAVDVLPFGWRALYAVGVLPVLLLPFLSRSLVETRRFERERGDAEGVGGLRGWLEPIRLLARSYPGRALGVGLAGLLSAASGIAFFQYASFFVQEFHGWAPGHYSLLVLGGGLIALFGNVVGGRGSDRFGRRWIGFGAWLCVPAFVTLFYRGPEATLALAWGLGALCGSAAEIVIRALATELFPTSHRAAASGWLVLVQTLGWSGGLLLVGALSASQEDLPRVIPLLSLGSVAAAFCLLALPESHRRELEELERPARSTDGG